jgi:methylmalonyl-CoA mutase cobalamin-binding subunit
MFAVAQPSSMSTTTDIPELLPITEVERQTGIRQATLRMWEKRYGFPQPLRDRHGDRVYPRAQVDRLHAVQRLIARGIRPGKILCGEVAVEELASYFLEQESPEPSAEQLHVVTLLREYRVAELHSHFQHLLLDLGLRRFVIEFLAPLCTAVGAAWSRGELPVRSEHLFAQLAASILHAKQAAVRTAGVRRPKVVLATLTGEAHSLGILMVEAVMAAHGADCVQLGSETPPLELAAAAAETGADIVALSFAASFPPRILVRMVTSLCTGLPPSVEVWIGGEGAREVPPLSRRVQVFDTLEAIAPALVRWRSKLVGQSLDGTS